MQKWEYRQVWYSYSEELDFMSFLNQEGSKGWEVVFIKEGRVIFKRPKS